MRRRRRYIRSGGSDAGYVCAPTASEMQCRCGFEQVCACADGDQASVPSDGETSDERCARSRELKVGSTGLDAACRAGISKSPKVVGTVEEGTGMPLGDEI